MSEGRPDSRPDVVIIMTDEERATPPYEKAAAGPAATALARWRDATLTGRAWFDEHGVRFERHYTGSVACVPSRPTIFTGQYPDLHGVTQTDGLGKMADDTRLRWLRPGEVPTLGNWFRAAGYDTHYDGKWHISHADLFDPATGAPLATNDAHGNPDEAAVQRYLEADPLGAYGFSGWVGPEPHGGRLADSGLVRDPLIADRVVRWLEDRYARRRAGDAAAQRPFLLVASFVNPHDIVLFPIWIRKNPLEPSPLDPPPVPAATTADEDLSTKPAAQIAYRTSYPSAYGPVPAVKRLYDHNAQAYRDLYHRLHAEVDAPIDRVRRAVTEGTDGDAVLVRTADHGDLLGAHGGLHQKWFNLYDEATRVPFVIARVGAEPTERRTVTAPTSHVDIVPTLLAVAGIDEEATAASLAEHFSEVHPLPGRDLTGVVDGGAEDPERHVYLMTRDNMLEGDTLASGLARRLGRVDHPPKPLRIQVPAHVGSNFEAVVSRADDGHLWKLVRTHDDPATWTEPHVRHLAASPPTGDKYRTEPLADQWELYDLDTDPVEAHNRADDPEAAAVRATLQVRLVAERERSIPERNRPWPYERRRPTAPAERRARPPARAVRALLHKVGMHPDDTPGAEVPSLIGHRVLLVATNHGVLDVGKPTGVFASELTVPYYVFEDAGAVVDVASPAGGTIPVDPLSLRGPLRTAADDRFLADDTFRAKVTDSLAVGDLDADDYSIVYLAGGWGAAFDLGRSDELGALITAANARGTAIGGICHGPLGLLRAKAADGRPLVEGRRVSAVTDKQVTELGIEATPLHPETELRAQGAVFASAHAFRDVFANHWVVDGNLATGQNQNAGPMVARELARIATTKGN